MVGGQKGGPERWGATRVRDPNFALFFSSSHLKFHSLHSLGASSRGISVVFEEFCGSSCETPAAPPDRAADGIGACDHVLRICDA